MLPGEKLFEALMTREEALFATEYDDYYKVEPLKSVERARLAAPPTGYDSESQPLLSVDEIADMLENHGLIEVFLDAHTETPVG
jgi:FlaA1/EpsC-like NDP-sugar epimerase